MIIKFKIFEGKKIVIDEYSFTILDIAKYYNEFGKYKQTKTKNFIIKYLTGNTISIKSEDFNGNYKKITPIVINYDPAFIDQFTLNFYLFLMGKRFIKKYNLRDNDIITIYNISGYLRKLIEKIELKKDLDKYNL